VPDRVDSVLILLGQIIMAMILAVVGYLSKKQLEDIKHDINRHDILLIELIKDVARLSGRVKLE
jgi:hypothetical protein